MPETCGRISLARADGRSPGTVREARRTLTKARALAVLPAGGRTPTKDRWTDAWIEAEYLLDLGCSMESTGRLPRRFRSHQTRTAEVLLLWARRAGADS